MIWLRRFAIATVLMVLGLAYTTRVQGDDKLSGTYVEARTCQIYTGPCFANGEVGSAGKDAVLTWRIAAGKMDGVDLADKSVALVIQASYTLGFNGFDDAKSKKAFLIVDQSASSEQAAALKRFVLSTTGLSGEDVVAEQQAEINLDLNISQLTAHVRIEDICELETRKARKGDCICSNESAYYPPLAQLDGFVPGVTVIGDVKARCLGTRWSIPDSRTSYMGTFRVDVSAPKLASAR